MFKTKYIFAYLTLFVILFSCEDDNFGNNPFADVDHEALAISDNDSIVKFLKAHYYDLDLDSIKPIVSGKQPMFEDQKLDTLQIRENDIDYILYVYVAREGGGNPNFDLDKQYPSEVDSVFTTYTGKTFTGNELSTSNFDQRQNGIWFNLLSVVKGWSYGFKKFKSGELKTEPNGDPFNGPITYLNGGKGAIFIPSGLAYPSSNQRNWSNSLVDTNIMFYVDLLTFVPDTDHDNDGVRTLDEDLDGDGNVNNDDTDEDSLPNFFDTDDDGDGILTKKEDANGDGDPTNDFSDPNNPDLPDYLNPDIS